MKHTFSILSFLLTGAVACAAGLSQLTLSFSTPGPDLYADGAPVLAGETYLLVYVAQGSTFKGVQTDGTLVDPAGNTIVTKSYAVAGSKCGFKAIQYPAQLYPSGGSWVVVLLDTRDASGAVGGLVAAQGAGAVKAAASADSTSLNAITAGQGGAVLTSSALSPAPAGTPSPVLAGVQPQGGAVALRLQNVTDKALYEVQSTTDLKAGSWQPAEGGKRLRATGSALVQGAGGAAELPVSVQVPPSDKVRFFRVIVPGGAGSL